jgi:hypothetical protein
MAGIPLQAGTTPRYDNQLIMRAARILSMLLFMKRSSILLLE